jgi:hypothetical protein
MGAMKTSIDIPDQVLEEVIRHTGAGTKREAVVIAISDYNRRKRLEKICEMFGTFEGFPSAEELVRMREEG